MAELMANDPANPLFMDCAQKAESLEEAMESAREFAQTDKILVFDGSFGNITLSPSLAEYLMRKAPEIEDLVEKKLLPLWLKQRGIDPGELKGIGRS